MRMMVLLAGCFVAGASPAQSLHLSPAGTVASGSFELAGKTLPLPAGEFIVAAVRVDESGGASVFLAQLDGQWLKSAVWASTAPEPSALSRHDSLIVEQRVRAFGAGAAGLFKDAAAWLAYHDVVLPVPILVVAEVTRIERRELVHAAYAFHPASYGCSSPTTAFVDSVTTWGKGVQQYLDNAAAGRPNEPFSSGIHQCVSAVALRP